MTLSLIYIRDFLFCLEHYAWLGSSGFQDLFGTEISWLLNISPELWVLSSPCTFWYPRIHIASYVYARKQISCWQMLSCIAFMIIHEKNRTWIIYYFREINMLNQHLLIPTSVGNGYFHPHQTTQAFMRGLAWHLPIFCGSRGFVAYAWIKLASAYNGLALYTVQI